MTEVAVPANTGTQNLTDSPHYLAELLLKNGV